MAKSDDLCVEQRVQSKIEDMMKDQIEQQIDVAHVFIIDRNVIDQVSERERKLSYPNILERMEYVCDDEKLRSDFRAYGRRISEEVFDTIHDSDDYGTILSSLKSEMLWFLNYIRNSVKQNTNGIAICMSITVDRREDKRRNDEVYYYISLHYYVLIDDSPQ